MPFPIGSPLEWSLNPDVFEILRTKRIEVTSLTYHSRSRDAIAQRNQGSTSNGFRNIQRRMLHNGGHQGRRKRYASRHTNPKFGMATPYQSKVKRLTCLSFVTSHG